MRGCKGVAVHGYHWSAAIQGTYRTPRGYSAPLPGRDHGNVWYDPVAKHHVGADEPYAASVPSKIAERDAWARQHNWSLAIPEWAGMYYPEGGSELYLYADASKGYSLDGLLKALSKAPSPIVPENCARVATDGHTPFVTPGEKAEAEAKLARNGQRNAPSPGGPKTTVEYRLPLSGKRSRRPARVIAGSRPVVKMSSTMTTRARPLRSRSIAGGTRRLPARPRLCNYVIVSKTDPDRRPILGQTQSRCM